MVVLQLPAEQMTRLLSLEDQLLLSADTDQHKIPCIFLVQIVHGENPTEKTSYSLRYTPQDQSRKWEITAYVCPGCTDKSQVCNQYLQFSLHSEVKAVLYQFETPFLSPGA